MNEIKTLCELLEEYSNLDIVELLNHIDNYLTSDMLEALIQQYLIDYKGA